MIVVTYEMRFAHDVSDRVCVFMADGYKMDKGSVKAFCTNPGERRIKNF